MAYSAASGSRLWARRYDGPTNQRDFAASIAVGPNGSSVFVTGNSSGGPSFDYATVAYGAATGALAWTARYDGTASSSDFAFSVGLSPDGSRVYITGQSWGSDSGFDYVSITYGALSGAPEWTRRYNGPVNGIDNGRSLAVSPDGTKVIVTGTSESSVGADFATLAYSA